MDRISGSAAIPGVLPDHPDYSMKACCRRNQGIAFINAVSAREYLPGGLPVTIASRKSASGSVACVVALVAISGMPLGRRGGNQFAILFSCRRSHRGLWHGSKGCSVRRLRSSKRVAVRILP